MIEPETKICPMCAEPVKKAARLCPFCRADLRLSAIRLRIPDWFSFLFIAVILAGLGWLVYQVVAPYKDFTDYQNEFVVVSSSVQFNRKERDYITTVGTIRNDSRYPWKNLQIEVQYYDQAGKLIDVGREKKIGETVQKHSEISFRVRTPADQPASAYATHKVFVRSAEDVRRWP